MPSPSIINPGGAFGAPVVGTTPTLDGLQYSTLIANTAITAGFGVGVSANGQAIVGSGGTGSTGFIGIALDTVTAGQAERVVTNGVVLGIVNTSTTLAITAGNLYSITTGGAYTAASTVIGWNAFMALSNAATGGSTFNAFVNKM